MLSAFPIDVSTADDVFNKTFYLRGRLGGRRRIFSACENMEATNMGAKLRTEAPGSVEEVRPAAKRTLDRT